MSCTAVSPQPNNNSMLRQATWRERETMMMTEAMTQLSSIGPLRPPIQVGVNTRELLIIITQLSSPAPPLPSPPLEHALKRYTIRNVSDSNLCNGKTSFC